MKKLFLIAIMAFSSLGAFAADYVVKVNDTDATTNKDNGRWEAVVWAPANAIPLKVVSVKANNWQSATVSVMDAVETTFNGATPPIGAMKLFRIQGFSGTMQRNIDFSRTGNYNTTWNTHITFDLP